MLRTTVIRSSTSLALAVLVSALCACSDEGNSPWTRAPSQDAGADVALEASQAEAAADSAPEAASEDVAEPVEAAAQDVAQQDAEDPAAAAAARQSILDTASGSACYDYEWKDRGQAPLAYIKGMALVYGRAVCNQSRSDVVVVSKAKTSDGEHDALAWYSAIFSGLGMSNDAAGVDTLRHAYTLLTGLGMRESSGEHCCGRDTSASNTSAETAEAGAWQTSWNSHVFSTELPLLFDKYMADDSGCLLDVFSQGVTCSASNWESYGSGDGFDFQELEKNCPAFAAEYAAVMLRVSGGSVGHYGPLRTRAAEVRPECDELFQQVQAIIAQTPSVCGLL